MSPVAEVSPVAGRPTPVVVTVQLHVLTSGPSTMRGIAASMKKNSALGQSQPATSSDEHECVLNMAGKPIGKFPRGTAQKSSLDGCVTRSPTDAEANVCNHWIRSTNCGPVTP